MSTISDRTEPNIPGGKTALVEITDRIASVTMNRPEKRNAISPTLAAEMRLHAKGHGNPPARPPLQRQQERSRPIRFRVPRRASELAQLHFPF